MNDSSSSDENINETDSSEDFGDSFLICSGYGNEPEYTEHEMNSLVYSDGSETSEEDENTQDMFRYRQIYIYILPLINYLYLHWYCTQIVFKFNCIQIQ